MRDGSFVAVGWDQLGDLTTLIYDPEALERRAALTYPEGDPKHVRRTVTRFVAAPHVGDIVVPAAGLSNLALGRFCGGYAFAPEPLPHAPHHRAVEWLTTDPWPAHVPAERTYPEGYQTTFASLFQQTTLADINERAGIRRLVFGIPYRRANENVTTLEAEPFRQDPNEVDKGRRGHNRTQNRLADLVARRGLHPLNGDQKTGCDVAWWKGASLCVAEVKSLPVKSEENQLRLGLGQVLRHRYALSLDGVDVVAFWQWNASQLMWRGRRYAHPRASCSSGPRSRRAGLWMLGCSERPFLLSPAILAAGDARNRDKWWLGEFAQRREVICVRIAPPQTECHALPAHGSLLRP
jgi:hypothetical protein